MYSGIVLHRHRQWSRLACLCRCASTLEGQKLPEGSAPSEGISAPPRIARGPTDILDALAATVGPDPTAAHYKYHDDPYLIPLSNYRKRAYALSTEAGRRAASWIRDNHPELFNTRVWDPPGKMKTPYFNADPAIQAYSPKPIYTSESKVTEDDLRYTIDNALVEDSLQVFHLLGGVEGVGDELKIRLLQLLCFCNEKEVDSSEWMEERWFANASKERHATTWRVGGLAEKIFNSMEPKTPEAYCAIIQGMAKYYQAERAHLLAQEATEQKIPLSTDVYAALIGCIGFLKEGATLRIEALKQTLVQMGEQGIAPSQATLAACLRSVSAWGGGKPLQQLATQLLAEFRQAGVQPGLSALYYLLCLFCKERGPRVDILSSILNDLESRPSLHATLPTDTSFFITAMSVCSDHLQDVALAERVHALLMKGDNYRLVGDAYKESIYYRHYVTVNCRHAPFEKAMQILDTLVPNVYVPEPTVMEEIIKTLELSAAGERLAQAWSQLVIFGHARRVRLVERLLTAMVNCYDCQDDEVKAKIRAAATEILNHGHGDDEMYNARANNERPDPPKLSATALSDVASLCSHAAPDELASWGAAAEALQRLGGGAVGVAGAAQLAGAAGRAAAAGKHGLAAAAVTYLAEQGFEEATGASVSALGAMLNRSEEEVKTLLKEPVSSVADHLQPSAVAVLQAYHMASTGAPATRHRDASSSDSSDSESSEDEM